MGQKGTGRMIQVGIAKEAVRGTAEASPTFWLETLESAKDEKFERVNLEQANGRIEDSNGLQTVARWAEGSLRAYADDTMLPLVLYSLFGTLNSATKAGESAVYEHTITVAQTAQHQSLTIFENDPLAGVDYKHALGVISSLEMAFEHNKVLDYSVTFMSKKGESATLTPAATTVKRFLPKHFVFKLASTQAGLDAASAISVNSLKLSINQNTEKEDTLGSEDPSDFLNKQFTAEGEVVIDWDATTYRDYIVNDTNKAMRIQLTHTDQIGTASAPTLKIDFYAVDFSELERSLALNDVVRQTLKFKAYYSSGDGKMVQAVATNTTASY